MPQTEAAISPSTCVSDYDRFAKIYNQCLAEDFCRRAFGTVEKLLLARVPPGSRILDLCCGTGQMARALVLRGYDVTGLDSSSEMLRLAREKVPEANFIAGDARDFHLPAPFDAAISTFNSLAHIDAHSDLVRVFRNVRNALRPGAPFLFDLSMEEAYTSKWRGSFTLVADKHACIVRPMYDARSRVGTNRITLFEFLSAAWRRSDFTITQKCHAASDVRSALKAAGYDDVRTYDAQRDLQMTGETGRTFFLCR
jgi:SAM-dependent methyltransferase